LIKFGSGFSAARRLLDAFGDQNFGETSGGDIIENKKTYLYFESYEFF
jgi:hypothetical protein